MIKRYDEIGEFEQGKYVLYSDYEALKKREAQLHSALGTLINAIDVEGEGTHYNSVIENCYSNAKAALNAERE